MVAGAVNQETIATLWSSFITPRSNPGDTLKDIYSPGDTPPELQPKTVAFPGQTIPNADYTIVSQLGEGGMGVVFEARQNHLNRSVALKMIRPERAGDPLARNCFFYEAVITAGLEHPGIVPILEFGRAQGGRDFYVMKKATGVPWSRVIRDKTLEENLAIFDRVADVVAYAHSRGVLHRDLKPANILLGDFGEAWVSDWGVAVARGQDGTYRHAHPGGTPQYMPPEMARCDSANLGPWSDIYLLGAILFEIVTGIPPHLGANVLTALESAANNGIAEAGSRLNLLTVANKAMASAPGHRYRSVQLLQQSLRRCLSEHEGNSLLEQANGQLAEAQRLGQYELYQQAVADYDAALAAFSESVEARNGRVRALFAYSRQALANAEYDLALSIIKPEIKANSKAARLAKNIAKEKVLTHRLRRRRKIVNTMLGLAVTVLLLGGAYVIHYRYDFSINFIRSNMYGVNETFVALKSSAQRLHHCMTVNKMSAVLRNDGELLDVYEEMLNIAAGWTKKFDEESWYTASKRNRVVLNFESQFPEFEDGILKARAIVETIPEPMIKRGLIDIENDFTRVVQHVNSFRVKMTAR